MIRSVLFAVCSLALFGCAMETEGDEVPNVEQSAEAQGMNMSRGGLTAPNIPKSEDGDQCGTKRIFLPKHLPNPTIRQVETQTR